MASWTQVKERSTDEARAVSEFVTKFSTQAQYLPEIEEKFLNMLHKTGIGRRFAVSNIPVSGWQSSTAVTVWQPGGPATALRWGPQENPILMTDHFRENELRHGAIYRFRGEVALRGAGFDGYLFTGDKDDPLTFGCICDDIGFVYLHGKGTVRTPAGVTVALPSSETQSTGEAQGKAGTPSTEGHDQPGGKGASAH